MSKLKGGLEDWVAQERAERSDRVRRRAQRSGMPGAFEAEGDSMDTSEEEVF